MPPTNTHPKSLAHSKHKVAPDFLPKCGMRRKVKCIVLHPSDDTFGGFSYKAYNSRLQKETLRLREVRELAKVTKRRIVTQVIPNS